MLEGTLDELLSGARSPDQVEARTFDTFEILSGKELFDAAAADLPVLVRGLVPESSIGVIAGHSGSYKTWHALVLLLDLALGRPYLGHPELWVPEPVSSLYINEEMGRAMMGDRLRKLVYSERYRDSEIDQALAERIFFIDDARLDLKTPESRRALVDLIAERDVKLAVFDSLSMVWSGDENSNSEVGVLYRYLREMVQETGCSLWLIHHPAKPSKERQGVDPKFQVRGAGQIIQQADSAIMLDVIGELPEQTTVRIKHIKVRVGRELPPFLTTVQDADGMAVDIGYQSTVAELMATNYADDRKNVQALDDWLLEICERQPIMFSEGMKLTKLYEVLKTHWPVSDHAPLPSKSTIHRRLTTLVEEQRLLSEGSQRDGFTYRLPESPSE